MKEEQKKTKMFNTAQCVDFDLDEYTIQTLRYWLNRDKKKSVDVPDSVTELVYNTYI